MIIPPPEQVTGVILAGGQARRMGGKDKGLIQCAGRPLVSYAIEALSPLCSRTLINANRSLEEYQRFDLPVVTDSISGFHGPLAGILSALETAHTEYVLVTPCDCPRLSSDSLGRVLSSLEDKHKDIAIAHDGKRLHPVVMALRTRLAGDLSCWLTSGKRKIDAWAQRHHWVAVDLSDNAFQFININTPEELEEYESSRN